MSIAYFSDNIVYGSLLVKIFAKVMFFCFFFFPVYLCSFIAKLELRYFSGNTWGVKNRNVWKVILYDRKNKLSVELKHNYVTNEVKVLP